MYWLVYGLVLLVTSFINQMEPAVPRQTKKPNILRITNRRRGPLISATCLPLKAYTSLINHVSYLPGRGGQGDSGIGWTMWIALLSSAVYSSAFIASPILVPLTVH
jgi:hypothetical protein